MKKSFETSIKDYTPFDLSFSLRKDNEVSNISIEEALGNCGVILDDSTKYITMNIYSIDFALKSILGQYTDTGIRAYKLQSNI